MLARTSALLLIATIAGCSGRTTGRSGNDEALSDTLSTLIAEAYDFTAPGALERMNGLYAQREIIVSAAGGQITLSADSVRAGIARFWEEAGRNMQGARWVWEDLHTERLGPDGAVLTGRWSIPHLTPDGREHVIAGAWTAAFRRIDGEWKIVQEHLSARQ